MTKLNYTVNVKNFDYFPLLRLLQMLHRLKIKVQDKQVSITLLDYTGQPATCDSKNEKVYRLVEQHFLSDLPLWGCLTGLREEEIQGIPV